MPDCRRSIPKRGAGVALRVQIDDQGLETLHGQCRGDVNRRRGLTHPTLLVGDGEDPATRSGGADVLVGGVHHRTARSASAPIGVSMSLGSHVSRETSASGPARAPRWELRHLPLPPRRPGLRAETSGPWIAYDHVTGGFRTGRHISPPSPRTCPMTSSHAGTRGLRPRRAPPSSPTSGPRPQQRRAPPGQLVQRGHRPRHHGVQSSLTRRVTARPRHVPAPR